MYNLSTNYANLDFKPFDCQEKKDKVNQFLALLHDPDIKPVLNLYLENFLATSELRVLKRLAALEAMLGLNDMEPEEELSIPAQLNLLASRIDNANVADLQSLEPIQAPATKTESRAHLLVAKLKGLRGKKFLSSKEVVSFLRQEIDEKFRVGDKQNVRQCKKEVLEKAAELFTDIKLDKKTYGRRE